MMAKPLRRIVPFVGNDVITTDCIAFAGVSLASVKPKSAVVKVRAVSSTAVSVAFVPDGASLTEVTLNVMMLAL